MSGAQLLRLSPSVTSISVPVRRDASLSWVPPGCGGWEASHVYLLRSPSGRLLIDTGSAAHWKPLREALAAELARGERVRALLTRIEPDCIGNLAALIEAGVVEEVLSTQAFDVAELLHLRARAPVVRSRRLRLGWHAELELEVCAPALRLLSTTWCWAPRTRSLWCSDAFGWAGTARPDEPPLLDGAVDRADPVSLEWRRDVTPFLLAKFDWLAGADSDRVQAIADRFFADRSPSMLLPTHGSVVAGGPAAEMVAALRAALAGGAGTFAPGDDDV